MNISSTQNSSANHFDFAEMDSSCAKYQLTSVGIEKLKSKDF